MTPCYLGPTIGTGNGCICPRLFQTGPRDAEIEVVAQCFFDKLGLAIKHFWSFLSEDPRESNTEGGIFPAIFGTVMMYSVA